MLAQPEVKKSPRVSIFAVVYRSIEYAEYISHVVHDSCPEIASEDAEFFLVANQPERKLSTWLAQSQIPYVEFWPKEELKADCGPDYLVGVYAAYNFGVAKSSGDIIVMLNSDMVPSPRWLQSMLEEYNPSDLLTPWLVEPFHPKYGVFPGAIEANFGRSPQDFDFKAWQQFCSSKSSGLPEAASPPFMPVMVTKDRFLSLGGFPEGNVQIDGECVPADKFYFESLKQVGLKQRFTSKPVYFYHFKEGEKRTETFFRLFTDSIPFLARKLKIDALLKIVRKVRSRW